MVMIPNPERMGDMPQGGTPVPEGVYHIRCDKATFKTTKKGEPMAEVQWTIFGPDDAEEFHGRKLFDNLMLAGEGRFRTRQVLEASGEDEDFILEDTDQLLQRECAAIVVVQSARDEVVDNVKKHYDERNNIKRYQSIE